MGQKSGIFTTIDTSALSSVFVIFPVGTFGIVFSNPCFNVGSIKQNHGCLFSSNALAYSFLRQRVGQTQPEGLEGNPAQNG